MKRLILLQAFLFVSITICLAQQYLPFAPMGATWYYNSNYCPNGGGPPDQYGQYTVTKDSIINGKYCTEIFFTWPCASGTPYRTYVHDDNGKIYRYEPEDGEFYLVIDYTKQVGETWIVEKLCTDWYGNDSAVVIVKEVHDNYRKVDFNVIGGGWGDNIIILEGGGSILGWPLIFFTANEDPFCTLMTLCYEDPTEGFIYGDGGASCFNATDDPGSPSPTAISVYPNPAQQTVTVSFSQPLPQKGEWVLSDGMGRVLHREPLAAGAEQYVVSLPELSAGLYFWSVSAQGARVQGGKLIISK